MSSIIARRCIALAIVVALPWPCHAQRGGDDTDAYPGGSTYERGPAEPPRLLRGGLMQQLRSVTESMLGTADERMGADSGQYDNPAQGHAPQRRWLDPRNGNASGADGENRSWAGQFLVPHAGRARDAESSSGQRRVTEPASRGPGRQRYLGQPPSVPADVTDRPTAPPTPPPAAPRNMPSGAGEEPADQTILESEEDSAAVHLGDASASAQTPPEVVVKDVPEVPYVPRKPLPKRSHLPAAGASGDKPPAATASTSSLPSVPSLSVGESKSAPSLSLPTTALPSAGSSSSSLPSPTGLASPSPSVSLPTMPTPGSVGKLSDSSPSISLPSAAKPAAVNSSTVNSSVVNSNAVARGSSAPAAGRETPTSQSNASKSAPAATADEERMHMEIPHVVVQLLGPGDLTTGMPTSYQLVVHNPDRIVLSGLILRMEAPIGVDVMPSRQAHGTVEAEKAEDGATLVTWNVANVPAGGSAKLPLDLKANSPRNFAVAIEWTVLPLAGVEQLVVKQADLQVALEGPVEVERNTPNIYRLRVTNPGNAAARNVKVQVSAGTQQASQADVGDLGPGESETIEMDLTFEKAGKIQIGAHALADGQLQRDTSIAIAVRQAVLQAKVTLPPSVPQGAPAVATVELQNSGDGTARQVKAGLTLPKECEVVNLPSGVTRQGDRLTWEVEQIPAGQVVTVPLELRLTTAGTQQLKLACSALGAALASAEATTTVEAFADLKLSINDPQAPAPIGSPVTYEIKVTNRGTCAARNVMVVAQFSEGIEPQSASGFKNRVVPGQVVFEAIPSIAAGETVKIQVVAKASVAGTHRFRAEVRCEETDARLVGEESTRYLESASRIAMPPSTAIQR
ncbi:MAG: CARDB domain-containing protein [Aureliella sp.]